MGIVAAAALAVTAVSAYRQYQSAQDAADAREEAQDISTAQGTNRQNQQRRQQIREERIRRARILQASQNTGVSGSSSQLGALGSLGTQTAGNLAFMSSDTRAARGVGQANQQALDANTRGSLWQGVGQLSGSVFRASGGFGAFQQTPSDSVGTGQPTNLMDGTFTY